MRDATVPTEAAAKNPYLITSAYRTLRVLQAFAAAPHRFGLAELVDRLGVEKNQLYRSLKTLEAAGYLAVEEDGRFALTPVLHLLSAAAVHRERASLVDVARPHLDALVEATGESVNLFVRAGDHAVCVDRRDSPHLVRLASVLGRSVPLHAGAVPKAILAQLPEARRDRILARLGDYPRYTAKTVLEPAALRNELRAVRERGYSISDEDYDSAARGVGAAIFDADGDVVGGISVGGPSFRVDDAALDTFASLVTRVTAEISRRLGHTGSTPHGGNA